VHAQFDCKLDLESAMARLRVRERAMIWLAYTHGASHEEIARLVGVRATSIKPLLFRARRKLAALLTGASR
jgi:RNA polymerase sigma-70 factor (ECF subfamily)